MLNPSSRTKRRKRFSSRKKQGRKANRRRTNKIGKAAGSYVDPRQRQQGSGRYQTPASASSDASTPSYDASIKHPFTTIKNTKEWEILKQQGLGLSPTLGHVLDWEVGSPASATTSKKGYNELAFVYCNNPAVLGWNSLFSSPKMRYMRECIPTVLPSN